MSEKCLKLSHTELLSFLPQINSFPISRACRKTLFRFRIWKPSSPRLAMFKTLESLKRNNVSKRQAMLKCGILNVRSAVSKAPLLNEVIQANNLDVFIIMETWVPSDAPNPIKYGLAPEDVCLYSNRSKHQLLIGLINAIRICRRFERQSKRFCSKIIKTGYKKAKEIAKTLIMQSKIDSIKEELHSKSNPLDYWRSLLSRPPQHYSDDECTILVNSFANHFISKINNIHQSIKDSIETDNITPFKHRPQSTNIFDAFPAVSVSEVLKLISSLANKTSPLEFCLLFFSKNFLHSLLQ
ncbi:hypothetical protein HELRODRAFT_180349 [Helobdella robusta]|uniref:Uncharacterized protein n=1 Tax=Helobdella robusta TaxID=6412 RepID=T1FFS8_HELRO|nr:hypothetical protein HELRODRAFT_180349 [Helobdella robusta]ESN93940.1 hypothetical protein HELRODRAFT_180349 [Helobdella robusta]